MSGPTPNRRAFLTGTMLGAAGGGAAAWGAWRWWEQGHPPGPAPIASLPADHAMPGKYPGRVIEVHHSGSVLQAKSDGYTQREPDIVAAMVARGMQELVGSE